MTVLTSFWLFGVYFISGTGMLAIFTRLYVFATPYDEKEQIKEGKRAPAIALAGAMLGFTIPIATMSFHGARFTDYLIWSIVAGCVQLACFKVMYRLLPKQIEADNCAAAIFYAGASICVGIINAFSLIP